MAKIGRPRLSAEQHWQQGTYRKDRHGPLASSIRAVPRRLGANRPASTPAGQALTGAAFVGLVRDQFAVDDPVACVLLQAASAAHDRRVTASTLLDGADGLLQQLATGKIGLTAKTVETILKAEQLAGEALVALIDRLHLDNGPSVLPVADREAAS